MRKPSCSVLSMFAAGWLSVTLLYSQSATAQTTCTAAPSAVQSFSIERAVIPSNIETTYDTSLPPSILASLAADALEIRERIIYNPPANTLTSTVFLVEPGSPIPTPLSVDISSMTLATYTISVGNVYLSCTPLPSVLFAGTVTSSVGGPADPTGIYNLNFDGAPATVSIGYTTDNPPMINNVVVLFAGLVASYSATGAGTLTFPSNSVAPPGQSGSVTIVLSINGVAQSLPLPQSPIQLLTDGATLDASKSTASGGTVSFQWSANPPVALGPSESAPVISIQFPAKGFSTTITLTVTTSAGQTTAVSIPLIYI